MKKALCTLLALVMILGCTCIFTACGKEEAKVPAIPEGYQKVTVEDIAFACPEGWKKQDGSVVMFVNQSGQGNNITVVYTQKDNTFDNMTVEKFNKEVKPSYEATGLRISNVSVETVKSNGLTVVKMGYTARYGNTALYQTQYVTHIGKRTYVVTVTATSANGNVATNVLETLHKAK